MFDKRKKPCSGSLQRQKSRGGRISLHHDDDTYLQYHSGDTLSDINRQLGFTNRKFIYLV